MMHYHVCIFKDKESSEMRVAPQKFPAALRGHLKGHKNTHDYQIDINKVETFGIWSIVEIFCFKAWSDLNLLVTTSI